MPSDSTHNPTATEFDYASWFNAWQREYLLYRLTPDGVILYMSPSVREILGYEPEEMIGRHVNDFLVMNHPVHALIQDLSDRLWPGEIPMHRCVARKRNGEELYLAARERKIFDDAEVHVATERMAHDDTHRVQAELSLRQSERRYRRLVEGIRGDYFIYTHDNQGVITYVSPSVKNVMGYNPEDVLGRNWRELVKEEYQGRQRAENVRQDIYAGKKFHRLVVEMDHADKGTRLLELQVRQLYGPDGEFTSLEGIARDITEITNTTNELKQLKENLEERVAERTSELVAINEKLVESEERYRSVVENQVEFIVHWTPDLRRTFVNEAYARYLGKPAEELVNQPFMPVIFKDDVENFTNAMHQLTPQNNSVTYEHRVLRPDGKLCWAQWTDRAFFDEEGQPTAYLSVGRDVTALKEAEDELRQKELLIAHVSRLATMGELVAG
ncbi:MAG: PAS domain S-box protein, partial [Lacipirellulaceae bacterium]